MTYATLMVNLEPGKSKASPLQLAGDLAERFDAAVVGIAACQPVGFMPDSMGYSTAQFIEPDRLAMKQDLEQAEAEFRSAVKPRVGQIEWRSTVTLAPIADFIVREARSADLVVTGVSPHVLFGNARRTDPSDLVMQAGRPILVVPTTAATWTLKRVLIGWKDTRETRRAILDALPLLKTALHVSVVEIAGATEITDARKRVADVATWLKRHGVAADCVTAVSTGDDAAALEATAQTQDAEVIVAGAYGHSRMREWMLGGVTRGAARSCLTEIRGDGSCGASHQCCGCAATIPAATTTRTGPGRLRSTSLSRIRTRATGTGPWRRSGSGRCRYEPYWAVEYSNTEVICQIPKGVRSLGVLHRHGMRAKFLTSSGNARESEPASHRRPAGLIKLDIKRLGVVACLRIENPLIAAEL